MTVKWVRKRGGLYIGLYAGLLFRRTLTSCRIEPKRYLVTSDEYRSKVLNPDWNKLIQWHKLVNDCLRNNAVKNNLRALMSGSIKYEPVFGNESYLYS